MQRYIVDLLLSCGCVTTDNVESVIDLPPTGQHRHCPNHKRDTIIIKIGSMYQEIETSIQSENEQ